MNFTFILVIFFMVATLAVLLTGVILMMKGGKLNQKYSNKLMVARVALQGMALAALALGYFLYKK